MYRRGGWENKHSLWWLSSCKIIFALWCILSFFIVLQFLVPHHKEHDRVLHRNNKTSRDFLWSLVLGSLFQTRDKGHPSKRRVNTLFVTKHYTMNLQNTLKNNTISVRKLVFVGRRAKKKPSRTTQSLCGKFVMVGRWTKQKWKIRLLSRYSFLEKHAVNTQKWPCEYVNMCKLECWIEKRVDFNLTNTNSPFHFLIFCSFFPYSEFQTWLHWIGKRSQHFPNFRNLPPPFPSQNPWTTTPGHIAHSSCFLPVRFLNIFQTPFPTRLPLILSSPGYSTMYFEQNLLWLLFD